VRRSDSFRGQHGASVSLVGQTEGFVHGLSRVRSWDEQEKRVTENGRGTRHAIKQKGLEKWNWADVESGLERARHVEGSSGLHNADGQAFVITSNLVNES